MMPDKEILTQMIKDTVVVPLQYKYNKPLVELCEPQAPDSSVTIHHVPDDAVVIKADAFCSPDAVFKGEKGECKRADYVIISAKKRCIIYVEMKRTKAHWNQIVQQLLGAQCFIRYCQEVGREFWREYHFLNGYKHRFVSIGHMSIPKKGTRIIRAEKRHDTPHRALKIDWPKYVEFDKIAGLRS
jgi:hypothetical protein